MTVRIFIDWFLPAYKAGGPVQTVANLVAQGGEGITYKIISSNKELDGSITDVKKDRWTSLNPWTAVFYAGGEVPQDLLGNRDDVLFLNGIYSWTFTLKPLLFSRAKRRIVSARGMLLPGALAQKRLKKKIYLTAWKWAGLHRKVAFHACNRAEELSIRQMFGEKVTVYIAANFPRVFQQQAVPNKKRGELHLVSVALISPMKNILPVLQALAAVPGTIVYHIFGPVKEEAYWQSCLRQVEKLPANVQVRYHGDVHPQAVEESLHSGQVFILPSRSENFGHALYEAMTAGKPVITSHTTPWNGLEEAKAGLNVAPDKIEELAAAIRFFAAMDRMELQAWSNGAKAYSEKALNLEEIKQQYRDMFGY